MEIATILGLTLALGAGAIAKGATGMGLPLVALPALTALLGLQHAIGVMLVPILVTNAWQVWRYRNSLGDPGLAFLPWFIAAGVFGIALGTWALGTLSERLLTLTLGLILIGYFALRMTQPNFSVGGRTARRLAAPMGLASGALQGATGISAPIGVTFIHAMRLDRPRHVGAVSAMFLAFAAVQLPAVFIAGIFQPAWLAQGFFALLPVLAFMPVGEAIGRRVSRATFDRIILIFLAVVGAKLALGL